MTEPIELRVCYHGGGPVRATAWWIFADGSTSEHFNAVRPTGDDAIRAVRAKAGAARRPAPPQPLHDAPRIRHRA